MRTPLLIAGARAKVTLTDVTSDGYDAPEVGEGSEVTITNWRTGP